MDAPRIRNRCEACRFLYPNQVDYYPEKSESNDDRRKSHSRSSSAGSSKLSSSRKVRGNTSTKLAASDSSIMTSNRTRKAKKHKTKLDERNVQQLKEDLNLIKQQLLFLTENRNEVINVSHELQERYVNLLDINRIQEGEIENLKRQNASMNEEMKKQDSLNKDNVENILKTKSCLDDYEDKLQVLYSEFVDSSKVMQEHRDNLCSCIKKKNVEFQQAEKSNVELCQELEQNKIACNNLQKSYEKAKKREEKYKRENKDLLESLHNLEDQLSATLQELDRTRAQSLSTPKIHEEKNKTYSYQWALETREVNEQNGTLKELKSEMCKCGRESESEDKTNFEAKYEQLRTKYKEVHQQLRVHEDLNKKRAEELQSMRKRESDLMADISKLQCCTNKLTELCNNQSITIAEINNSLQEKETIVQCQRSELAAKEKQIELMAKNEDRLKRRSIQLQEDLLTTQMSNSRKENSYCADECSGQLTEELQDLLTALYQEIDKTVAKDEYIRKQNQDLCCLQCNLSAKEKDLMTARTELQTLREQFCITLKEKHTLAKHLMQMQDEKHVEVRQDPRYVRQKTRICFEGNCN